MVGGFDFVEEAVWSTIPLYLYDTYSRQNQQPGRETKVTSAVLYQYLFVVLSAVKKMHPRMDGKPQFGVRAMKVDLCTQS